MNFKQIAEELGLEEKEYFELLHLFITTAEDELEKIHDAIKEDARQKVLFEAHSIKGAAGNLGLLELSEAARRFEADAKQGNRKNMAQSFQALERDFETVKTLAGD
jgi:HPt (histidine-containing phosphotransfer) domain-containing protein